jgi:ABC-type bacteriocin/lantibiotic exporter with double-glycine peptidase domain
MTFSRMAQITTRQLDEKLTDIRIFVLFLGVLAVESWGRWIFLVFLIIAILSAFLKSRERDSAMIRKIKRTKREHVFTTDGTEEEDPI